MESSRTLPQSHLKGKTLHPLVVSFYDDLCRRVGGQFLGIQIDGRPKENPLVLVRSLVTGSTIAIPYSDFNTFHLGLALIANVVRFEVQLAISNN